MGVPVGGEVGGPVDGPVGGTDGGPVDGPVGGEEGGAQCRYEGNESRRSWSVAAQWISNSACIPEVVGSNPNLMPNCRGGGS